MAAAAQAENVVERETGVEGRDIGTGVDCNAYLISAIDRIADYATSGGQYAFEDDDDVGLMGDDGSIWRGVLTDELTGQFFQGCMLTINPGCGCKVKFDRHWFAELPRESAWKALNTLIGCTENPEKVTIGEHIRLSYSGANQWEVTFRGAEAVSLILDHTLAIGAIVLLLEVALHYTGLQGWRLE